MKKFFSLMVFSLLLTTGAWAQSMSDNQVVEYVKSATEAGKSQKQIMTELAAKGVTRAQAERIKKRYEEQQAAEQGMGAIAKNRQRTSGEASEELVEGEMDQIVSEMSDPTEQSTDVAAQLVFGRNIFNSRNLTFAPSHNIPTPVNYRLGAGDEVIIDIWGNIQISYRETITPEGNINIPNVGPIYLNGMNVKEAESFLKKELNKIHAGIDGENPVNEMKLTLGQIRTIQVNVMGEVAVPGTYNLSSFANMFHAIYRAGGIGKVGSLRNIHLMRGGRKVASVDIYEFILKGKTMDDIRLH